MSLARASWRRKKFIVKPAWLNKKIDLRACAQVKQVLRELRVETVCEQAMCPNIGECFSRNEATFLILGRHCTRMCSFCNIEKGKPSIVDFDEPERVACAVEKFSLKHVVITSVTRDDLKDGGAGIFAETVLRIRSKSGNIKIEILIPDFQLSLDALAIVAQAPVDIIAHNVETVPSLYSFARQGADYARSLDVLRQVKKIEPDLKTKSGIMLGLGEKQDEVIEVLQDLRLAGCDFVSIGQYLAPSGRHYPVKEYIEPERFYFYKEQAKEIGFLHVESGAYVRSSYLAGDYLKDVDKKKQ
ncbi:MAG: lipoyl synthase [Candidatus Omnitrophica bacterium]|nr:lipoyl synthase [Candidatus Omnitrophota bacterium]